MKSVTYQEVSMNFIESLVFKAVKFKDGKGRTEYIPHGDGEGFLTEFPEHLIIEETLFVRESVEYDVGSHEDSVNPVYIVTYLRSKK